MNNRGRWKPGESGNPAGRPKGRRNRRMSRDAITALYKLVRERAEGGDPQMIELLTHDRLFNIALTGRDVR